VRRRLFNLAAAISLVLCVASTVTWVLSRGQLRTLSRTRTTASDDDHRERRTFSLVAASGRVAIYDARVTLDLAAAEKQFHWTVARDMRRQNVPSSWTWRSATTRRFLEDTDHETPLLGPFLRVASREDSFAGGTATSRGLTLSLGALATVTALLPLGRVIQIVRRRVRHRSNRCPTCGYDCRGPAVGTLLPRCPECGTDLPPPKPATGALFG
jgi:hypothetical protein